MSRLEVRDLTKRFGGVVAVDSVSFSVGQGETVGLIGPNGAGKTTLFNCVTGVLQPTRGAARFGHPEPSDILGAAPERIVALGMARTFQNIRLFRGMTALENVLVGTFPRTTSGVFGATLDLPGTRREERRAHAHAMACLEFTGLADQAETPAASLSYGWQRRLEIARALASEPSLLLLDEPAAGLNAVEKQALLALFATLKGRGMSLLLIEHDMQVVMPVSDRVIVLDYGKKIAEGPPQAVQADKRVIEAYLGAAGAERGGGR